MRDLHAFTCRIPIPVYRALRAYAALTDRTMGDVIETLLVDFLAEGSEVDAELRSLIEQIGNP